MRLQSRDLSLRIITLNPRSTQNQGTPSDTSGIQASNLYGTFLGLLQLCIIHDECTSTLIKI